MSYAHEWMTYDGDEFRSCAHCEILEPADPGCGCPFLMDEEIDRLSRELEAARAERDAHAEANANWKKAAEAARRKALEEARAVVDRMPIYGTFIGRRETLFAMDQLIERALLAPPAEAPGRGEGG